MTSAIMGQSAPEKGAEAPGFAYPSYDGQLVSMEQLRGRVTLLAFWFPGCGPCRAELPQLEPIYQKFKDKGLEIVALDITGQQQQGEAFLTDKGLSYTFLNADQDVVQSYAVRSTPTLVLVDADGSVVKRFVGNHNGLEDEVSRLLNNR